MLGVPLTHLYHLSAFLQVSVEPSVKQSLLGQELGAACQEQKPGTACQEKEPRTG